MSGRRQSVWLTAVAVVLSLGLVGCGDPTSIQTGESGASDGGESTAADEGPQTEDPPPVVVRTDRRSLELNSHHHCYSDACVSGPPPAELPDLGRADQVEVDFPLRGWSFTASFTPSDEECGRVLRAIPVEPRDDGTLVLRPAGHADTYDVTLWGQGDDGDLFVAFRWTTLDDGPVPTPEAHVSVLADHDGVVDSYGVEMSVRNLAETPHDVSATITVAASNGESSTFEPTPAHVCEEGSLLWRGPDEHGQAAAALDGTQPFTYEVELTLDGVRHVAVATWPDDQIAGLEPYVALEFEPPLPAAP